MTGDELTGLIERAARGLLAHVDEFRELDAALGDGDLGITVDAAGGAVARALTALPSGTRPADVLLALAPEVARSNPSTAAALSAAALMAAAAVLKGMDNVDAAHWILAGRAAAEAIGTKGRSAVGDKTVLDSLVPSLDAAAIAPAGQELASALAAARSGVEVSAGLVSRKGRAAWIGERGVGHRDPGAVLYTRLLESLAVARDT